MQTPWFAYNGAF